MNFFARPYLYKIGCEGLCTIRAAVSNSISLLKLDSLYADFVNWRNRGA